MVAPRSRSRIVPVPLRNAPHRRDLDDRAQVHDAVVGFYREIVFDDVLGPVFDEVAEVDWSIHIPTLVDFWCRVLLGEAPAGVSIFGRHAALHRLEPLTVEMFDRWFELWTATVDGSWEGPFADRAKAHAARVLETMARKIPGFAWSPPVAGDGYVG